LDRDDSLAAEAIEVNVTGKTIQLRGTVRSEAQKTRVEAAARKAAGSTPIENQIQVQQR
jgi:osmotically-inducible protein OsmY